MYARMLEGIKDEKEAPREVAERTMSFRGSWAVHPESLVPSPMDGLSPAPIDQTDHFSETACKQSLALPAF